MLLDRGIYGEERMKSTIDEYRKKHPGSEVLYEEAQRIFPSGINHDVRRMQPFPLFITHGLGARKWDVDGNEYICYVMGHGALILGHSHPRIVEAVCDQIRKGTHLGCNTELELRWAESVKRLMPSIEVISFHSSGTEATLMAVRLARAYTKKSKIIKFKNHFHGWHDYVIAEAGKYSSSGIPESTSRTVVRLSAGDIAQVEQVLKEDRDIAGVILEPTGASMGCFPIRPEFLVQLREVTKKYGVLLLFDEVVTGFRTSPGGAQERFGVRPDITALAKILGGGLPAGAVGGKREIIEQIAFHEDTKWNTSERVSHPGTFNANPLSAAAGSRCLELIAFGEVNSRADEAAARLKSGLNWILRKEKVTGFAYGLASLVWVLLGVEWNEGEDLYALPYEKIKGALLWDRALNFKRAMLNAGVDIMGTSEFIVSAAHGEREVEDTLDAFEKALASMRSEGIL